MKICDLTYLSYTFEQSFLHCKFFTLSRNITTWRIDLTLLSSHFYITNSSHYLEILRLGAFILHFCAVIFTLQILHN